MKMASTENIATEVHCLEELLVLLGFKKIVRDVPLMVLVVCCRVLMLMVVGNQLKKEMRVLWLK